MSLMSIQKLYSFIDNIIILVVMGYFRFQKLTKNETIDSYDKTLS